MKIALTGASGHIGFNLCKKLVEIGHEVTVLQRQSHPNISTLNVASVSGNLMDVESLNKFIKGKEVVIHLAAAISINSKKHAITLEKTNVEGTSNVVKSCVDNNIRRLIHFSSVDAYDNNPEKKLDETMPLKESGKISYGTTKADSQRIAIDGQFHGIEVIVLCPTGVIGPEDHSPSLSGKMILQYASRQIPVLIPGGFNWVDVRDIVSSTITSIDEGVSGESYLLPGHFATNKEIAQLVFNETGSIPPKIIIPFWLAKLGASFVGIKTKMTRYEPLFTRESIEVIEKAFREISGNKAMQYLKHAPRPLEETIRDTINWFRNCSDRGIIR
ncbi:MAG: NAD-dependent epimerase/dehydratase family protein [Bacteroidetes bacterium]|nr:NAD-dependent epimerase/dehydratase family protein [Bacteroidota bacterium]MDA1121097.1 NAD-dependent epimerase/dehydratase family protein [Bacteroidota bacterium]